MPSGCDILPVSALLKDSYVDYFHRYIIGPDEIEYYGAETIVKFCSQKFLISSLTLF